MSTAATLAWVFHTMLMRLRRYPRDKHLPMRSRRVFAFRFERTCVSLSLANMDPKPKPQTVAWTCLNQLATATRSYSYQLLPAAPRRIGSHEAGRGSREQSPAAGFQVFWLWLQGDAPVTSHWHSTAAKRRRQRRCGSSSFQRELLLCSL